MSYPAKKENKYTYSDYLKTPEDKRFELIEGDLITTPSLVDQQAETIEVYSLEGKKFTLHQSLTKKETLASPLLPDFKANLANIFSGQV